ncbi:MAG: hypothetical protein HC808_04735 [Candidatus Competibacteraceae bacterium]|nr:hypothetical protein [Candidatus Competibacteraceae bacterium]
MLLSKQSAAMHMAAYTVNPECFISTLIMENGQEIVITDEMVEYACNLLEDSFYPLQVAEEVDEYADEEI